MLGVTKPVCGMLARLRLGFPQLLRLGVPQLRSYSRDEAEYWLARWREGSRGGPSRSRAKKDDLAEFGPIIRDHRFLSRGACDGRGEFKAVRYVETDIARISEVDNKDTSRYCEKINNVSQDIIENGSRNLPFVPPSVVNNDHLTPVSGDGMGEFKAVRSVENKKETDTDLISEGDNKDTSRDFEKTKDVSQDIIENVSRNLPFVPPSFINNDRLTPQPLISDLNSFLQFKHVPDRSVPSVTKILADTKSEESKEALARWERKKIQELGLDGFKKLKASTFERGHTLHAILETYMVKGKLPKMDTLTDDVSRRHVVSVSQVVRQFAGARVLESSVVHPSLGYCGIVDCVARLEDTLVLIDWKTSDRVKNSADSLYDAPLQVGRLGMSPDQFKVLLVASSFMSVNESRVGQNMSRVRMFGQDKLTQEVAKEKWDLIKVVATQPFTPHSRYGINFITVSGADKPVEKVVKPAGTPVRLGAFKLKAEDEDKLPVGSYFAKKKAIDASPVKTDQPLSVAASLRSEKTLADLALQQNRKEDSKRKREKKGGGGLSQEALMEAKRRKVDVAPFRRDILPGEDSDEEVKPSSNKNRLLVTENSKNKINDESQSSGKGKPGQEKKLTAKSPAPKRVQEKSPPHEKMKDKAPLQKKVKEKAMKTKPFKQLLEGVVFTISGFQNPLRGEIRQKGLDMGAKYVGDWTSSCTHLICAFINTPKFNQVAALQGRIVKKEWVEECHKERKRFPWRRFCLDKRDQGAESEEEVWEVQEGNVAGSSSRGTSSNLDCDTDEEIENVKRDTAQMESYELDTDEEIEKVRREQTEKRKQETTSRKRDTEEEIERDTNMTERNYALPQSYEADTDEEIDNIKKNMSKKTNNQSESYECETDEDVEQDRVEVKRRETKTTHRKNNIDKSNKMKKTGGTDTNELEAEISGVITKEKKKETLTINGKSDSTYTNILVENSKPYEEDTDEEVVKKFDSDDEAYNADTDIDDCEVETYRPKTAGIEMPALSQYFKSKQFHLHGQFSDGQKTLLKRYIVGFGGRVSLCCEKDDIVLVAGELDRELRNLTQEKKVADILRPDWVFACCDKNRVVDSAEYRVTG